MNAIARSTVHSSRSSGLLSCLTAIKISHRRGKAARRRQIGSVFAAGTGLPPAVVELGRGIRETGVRPCACSASRPAHRAGFVLELSANTAILRPLCRAARGGVLLEQQRGDIATLRATTTCNVLMIYPRFMTDSF